VAVVGYVNSNVLAGHLLLHRFPFPSCYFHCYQMIMCAALFLHVSSTVTSWLCMQLFHRK